MREKSKKPKSRRPRVPVSVHAQRLIKFEEIFISISGHCIYRIPRDLSLFPYSKVRRTVCKIGKYNSFQLYMGLRSSENFFEFRYDSYNSKHQRYESLCCCIFNIGTHCRTDYINTINRLSSSRSKSSKDSDYTDLYS